MNEKRKKKKKEERNELPMACFRAILRQKLARSAFTATLLVSSNRKLYHRRGDTICPSIEKRVELARSCNENIFRYKEGGIVVSRRSRRHYPFIYYENKERYARKAYKIWHEYFVENRNP